MNVDYFYVVCAESGTILPLRHAHVVDTRDLSEEQQDVFNNGADSEICELATETGRPVLNDSCLLDSIAETLWGADADKQWGADTLDAIADAIVTLRPDLYTKLTGQDPYQ